MPDIHSGHEPMVQPWQPPAPRSLRAPLLHRSAPASQTAGKWLSTADDPYAATMEALPSSLRRLTAVPTTSPSLILAGAASGGSSARLRYGRSASIIDDRHASHVLLQATRVRQDQNMPQDVSYTPLDAVRTRT